MYFSTCYVDFESFSLCAETYSHRRQNNDRFMFFSCSVILKNCFATLYYFVTILLCVKELAKISNACCKSEGCIKSKLAYLHRAELQKVIRKNQEL